MNFLGARSASVVLYLDNKPMLASSQFKDKIDVELLIAENGNHWRKILTIFAKLSTSEDWRSYRDSQLLQKNEKICFQSTVDTLASVHLFSGKNCWQRFNVTDDQLQGMQKTPDARVFYRVDDSLGLLMYTPYFDYRQFPNKLIEEVISIIKEYRQ